MNPTVKSIYRYILRGRWDEDYILMSGWNGYLIEADVDLVHELLLDLSPGMYQDLYLNILIRDRVKHLNIKNIS